MNISDTSNPEDSGIQDEEAVQMIIDLDAECGDYCSRDDALRVDERPELGGSSHS